MVRKLLIFLLIVSPAFYILFSSYSTRVRNSALKNCVTVSQGSYQADCYEQEKSDMVKSIYLRLDAEFGHRFPDYNVAFFIIIFAQLLLLSVLVLF